MKATKQLPSYYECMKGVRKGFPPSTVKFRDKSKYSRKSKHSKGWD